MQSLPYPWYPLFPGQLSKPAFQTERTARTSKQRNRKGAASSAFSGGRPRESNPRNVSNDAPLCELELCDLTARSRRRSRDALAHRPTSATRPPQYEKLRSGQLNLRTRCCCAAIELGDGRGRAP